MGRVDLKRSRLRGEFRQLVGVAKRVARQNLAIFNIETDRLVRERRLKDVRALVNPSGRHPGYLHARHRTFLAICHDQDIDRRIMQQVEALRETGWRGVVVAMSSSVSDEFDFEHVAGGRPVPVHRIGQARIVPDCEAYWAYQRRQSYLTNNPYLTNLNLKKYRRDLWRAYRCEAITHPLPFDAAFQAAGSLYPADLIFAHDLTALKAGAELARQWNAKLIYDSHEYYPEQVVFSEYQKALMHACERKYLPSCDRIITVSESIARGMAATYGLSNVPDTLTNVAKAPDVQPAGVPGLRERIESSDNEPIILYQGGMVRSRNLTTLIEGFLELDRSDVQLVFLGPRDPIFAEELQALADSGVRGRNIHFLDAVPQNELLEITATATFGVVPYAPVDLNTRYCMPNKLFEFIQARLPILANAELEEVSKLVLASGIGTVGRMSNSAEMATSLAVALSKEASQFAGALDLAAREYSWESVRPRFLQIVGEVCAGDLDDASASGR